MTTKNIYITKQPISLGMIRSDIMLETQCYDQELNPCKCEKCDHRRDGQKEPDLKKVRSRSFCCWKQVEINTIASGFGHLGPMSGAIHR